MEDVRHIIGLTIGFVIWFFILSSVFLFKYIKWIRELRSCGSSLLPQLIVVFPVFLILIQMIMGCTGNLGNIWPIVIIINNIPLFIFNVLLYHVVKRIWYNSWI